MSALVCNKVLVCVQCWLSSMSLTLLRLPLCGEACYSCSICYWCLSVPEQGISSVAKLLLFCLKGCILQAGNLHSGPQPQQEP